ncbi:hypothetical protein E4U41_002238 [Claviceps citrina]|nr:hypothetical protein E4U41_002238 [Claviceps citrina]
MAALEAALEAGTMAASQPVCWNRPTLRPHADVLWPLSNMDVNRGAATGAWSRWDPWERLGPQTRMAMHDDDSRTTQALPVDDDEQADRPSTVDRRPSTITHTPACLPACLPASVAASAMGAVAGHTPLNAPMAQPCTRRHGGG